MSSATPTSSHSLTAAGSSATSPSSPSAPSALTASMSAAELRAAFSFLPHIHALLTAMQFSSESAQPLHLTTALLSHLSAAHSLLASLPAIAVSSVEQQAEYERLCTVRDKKRELLRRYKIEVTDETAQRAGGKDAEGKQKQQTAGGNDATAMEMGT